MIWSYVLTLTFVFLVVKAASKRSNAIRDEINDTNKKTNETLIQAAQVERAVEQLEDTIARSKLEIDARSLNLTNYQTQLVYKMYTMNITITSIENYIKYDKKMLEKLKLIGFRLDFIIKLLKEDIKILYYRKEIGDEATCYRIVGNVIPLQAALAMNSINDSKVHEMANLELRSGTILIQELNLAKIKLLKAQRELLLLEQLFESKKEYYNTLTVTGRILLEQLMEYVKEAEEVIPRLEQYMQYLKAEEAAIVQELIAEERKKKPKFEEIAGLQKNLALFKKAISCYNKVENMY